MARTIIDDIADMAEADRKAFAAGIRAAQEQAFVLGAYHALIWLIAFYAAKERR